MNQKYGSTNSERILTEQFVDLPSIHDQNSTQIITKEDLTMKIFKTKPKYINAPLFPLISSLVEHDVNNGI